MHVADMRPAGDISLEIVSRPLLVAPTLQHTPFTETHDDLPLLLPNGSSTRIENSIVTCLHEDN